jgi:hypothetical protein
VVGLQPVRLECYETDEDEETDQTERAPAEPDEG